MYLLLARLVMCLPKRARSLMRDHIGWFILCYFEDFRNRYCCKENLQVKAKGDTVYCGTMEDNFCEI
jgi:hypothetical protein